MPATPSRDMTLDFLEQVFGREGLGYLLVRPLDVAGDTAPDDAGDERADMPLPVDQPEAVADAIASWAEEWNVLTSVAPRWEPCEHRLPGIRNCTAPPAVLVSVAPAGPHVSGSKTWGPEELETALRVFNGFGVPPTAVVDTGSGADAWWCFDRYPHLWDVGPVLAFLRKRALAVADRVGARVVNEFDLARFARFPGSLNHEHVQHGEPPQVVRVTKADWERRYTADDLFHSFRDGSKR